MKLQQGECEMGENVTEALESDTGWNVKDGVPLLIRWQVTGRWKMNNVVIQPVVTAGR